MEYHPPAKALAAAIRGAGSWQGVHVSEFPFPVLYYAIPYLAVPPGSPDRTYWAAALIWMAAWVSACVLLLRRTAEHIGGPLAGKLAAALTLAPPFVVYYSFGVAAEVPAWVGATLLAYGWVRCAVDGQGDGLTRGGLVAGLAGSTILILSRPNVVLIVALAAGAAIVLRTRPDVQSRRQMRFAAACATAMAAVVLGGFALTRHPGRSPSATPQGSELAHVVFHGRFQYRWEPWDWRFWGRETRHGSKDYAAWSRQLAYLERVSAQRGVDLGQLEWQWALNDVRHHPALALRSGLVRLLALQVALVNSRPPDAFHVGPVGGRVIYIAFHVFLNALSLLALSLAIWAVVSKPLRLAQWWPLWAPWAALTLFHALIYAEPRYLLPGRPGITVLAGVALAPVLRRAWARPPAPTSNRGGVPEGGQRQVDAA